MADFNVRADGVDVEQIMQQIRSRIRDKRGVDYTEDQIQELAKVKLEKFLDPRGVRSDLLEQFRRMPSGVPPTYEFDDKTLFQTDKAIVRFFRKLLHPVLKLMFNPNPLNQVLHQQVAINQFLLDRTARDVLFYEVVHNLVVEMTRATIEVKNMKMRVESIASRLEFNERRARALEAVVQYKPGSDVAPRGADAGRQDRDRDRGERGRDREAHRDRERRVVQARHQAPPPNGGDAAPNPPDPITGGESLRTRRRRRRRGRRSGPGFEDNGGMPAGLAAAVQGTPTGETPDDRDETPAAPDTGEAAPLAEDQTSGLTPNPAPAGDGERRRDDQPGAAAPDPGPQNVRVIGEPAPDGPAES
jgi:hypothetical protein